MDSYNYNRVSRIDNVHMLTGPRRGSGSLVFTGHHLLFQPNQTNDNNVFQILCRIVDRVCVGSEHQNAQAYASLRTSNGELLALFCKNFLILVFELPSLIDCINAAETIRVINETTKQPQESFAYFYRPNFTIIDDGWPLYDVDAHFMYVNNKFPDRFRITDVNKEFKVCERYPKKVIVPKGIGDDFIRAVAIFRRNRRFPVLSFVDEVSKTAVVRTSEPLLGPLNRRSYEDISMLDAFLGPTAKGFVFDMRNPNYVASMKANGGGTESQCQFFYRKWTVNFLDLPEPPELYQSLQMLIDVIETDKSSFLTRIANSRWMEYLYRVLKGVGVIVQSIRFQNCGTTQLLHGGSGTGWTLVMTSLVEVALNPDCRTMRGFQTLIEREFVHGGHDFVASYASLRDVNSLHSPVFLMFMNCIWQMMHTYPSAFEYNEHFLLFLIENLYASEFGTFLFSTDKEREKLGAYETTSIWSYVNHPAILSEFINPIFYPLKAVQYIWPVASAQSMPFWNRFFFRWQCSWADEDAKYDLARQIAEREKKLQSVLRSLLPPESEPLPLHSEALSP